MHRGLVAVVALLAVTAGCSAILPGDDAGEPDGAVLAAEYTVTVTGVVDGDTVRIRYRNGSNDTVRLLGIDTPETHVENDPTEFAGVPDTDAGRACLREAGRDATRFVSRRLLGEQVRVQLDSVADGRGYYDRVLAYVVYDDGRDLNHQLVASGHARIYPTEFERRDSYESAVDAARENGTGLWRCTTDEPLATDGGETGVVVETVHADAAGADRENLNDEYVVLANRADGRVDLGGWQVGDEAGFTYEFPAGVTLGPDETLTLYTGSGTDGEYYWGRASPVWNNDGDTVTVRAANGTVLATRSYG
jgi:micrococcal nuclease